MKDLTGSCNFCAKQCDCQFVKPLKMPRANGQKVAQMASEASASAPKLKTIVIGGTCVGKTSLVTRAVYGTFAKKPESTVGAGNVQIEMNLPEKHVVFNVWDTAGQEKYRSLTGMYFTGANIAILVFDITSAMSLRALKEDFLPILRARAPDDVMVVLVGNKSDRADEREVTQADAEEYEKELGAKFYIETSALTGSGVEDLFRQLAENVTVRACRKALVEITVDEEPQAKKKSCCA